MSVSIEKYFNEPIVIIGGGSIGQRHIKNLKQLGFSNVTCLKRKEDEKFAGDHGVKVITSYSEMISLKPKAVFICNPTSLHLESLEQAIAVGAHIFMEKPLIHDKDSLEKAKRVLKGHDKVFFIGFMLRFHPLVQKIKEILATGELGNVYSARFEFGSYLPNWHPYEDHRISYAARKELGGGVINTITHELDLIQYFFGKPEAVSAQKQNLGKLSIDVEELFEGTMIYNNKLVTLHLDYLQKDYDRRIAILCDEGAIRWDWHSNRVIVKKHKSEEQVFPISGFEVNKLYLDELVSFFELIGQNKLSHSLDSQHAIENTNLTLAFHQAAEEHRTIPIS